MESSHKTAENSMWGMFKAIRCWI